ncbi:MAG: polyhydroxyalkanoate synthesis repressor PhaR [Hyphomicrobiales bacterium]|nr:polyhydroxyalkanoate synthesis repressor PhaR [Hyphomicrobiales bacterium]
MTKNDSPAETKDRSEKEATTDAKSPVAIKKYANRRLYHTGSSEYVTLEDLARMVKAGEDFVVSDAKTGEDLTRSVLAQIIFEQENKGQNLLPITFMRQLIRLYGDSLEALVPQYLNFSLESLISNQQKLREQFTQALGQTPFALLEEQTRKNMAAFANALRMMSPFAMPGGEAPAETPSRKGDRPDEIEEMRREMDRMRERLERLAPSANPSSANPSSAKPATNKPAGNEPSGSKT